MKIFIEIIVTFIIGYMIWNEDALIEFEENIKDKIEEFITFCSELGASFIELVLSPFFEEDDI